MKLDTAWLGRTEQLKEPIDIRTVAAIERAARRERYRPIVSLVIIVGSSLALWALIAGIFILARG